MRIDTLSVTLRPRSMYEAADLGVKLCQTWLPSVFRCYLCVAAPVMLIALASSAVGEWLPVVVIWWLKPWFDRTLLFVLSRGAFGVPTTPRDLWAARASVLFAQSVLTGLQRRLSPWRSFTQGVYQLEGLRGAPRRTRVRQIRGKHGFTALLMTQAFAIAEFALLVAGISLIAWLTPHPASASVDMFDWQTWSKLINRLSNFAYMAAVVVVEPFFVAAGFGMYLNRRVELEAWDIEQEFRRAFAV